MEKVILKNGKELANSTISLIRTILHNGGDLYPAYSYIDDNNEDGNYVFESAITLPTRAFTETEYIKYTNFVDTLGKTIHGKYSILLTYDVSGYDYWKNIMQEDLSVFVRVEIYDNLSMNELGDLEMEIYQTLIKIRDFEDNIYKTDEEYRERITELD